MVVKITVEGAKLSVLSPYHPDFVSEAHKLNGKWDGSRWNFDARDEVRVRAALRNVYGTSGPPDTIPQVATVRVRINGRTPNPYFAYGREIARRFGRDSAVRLGDGVVIVEGDFPRSSGSRKSPGLSNGEIIILEVRDIPASLVWDNGVQDGDELVEITPTASAENGMYHDGYCGA